MPYTPEDLIEKVQAYFFTDEKLSQKFENFVGKNCHVIDLESPENKLVYTEIYEEYRDLFEQSLEAYIKSIGKCCPYVVACLFSFSNTKIILST